MALTVYGIPTCGTVKKARAWLDARRLPYTYVDLRTAPPTALQIRAWAAAFGTRAMRNTSGGSYRALGPEKDAWTETEWIAAFTADAMLLKRPIIERDGAPAVVGFNLPEAELTNKLG